MWAAQYIKFQKPKRWMTSGGLGTMGYGLPAAIGVQVANPKKLVVDVAGEASILMTMQEISTAIQYNLPIKIFILNNQYMGMVRQWQELFFDGRYASTVMTNPDFVKIVEGYSIKARKVTERNDLTQAIQEMVASKESYFLEVRVEMEENVFPMIPTGSSVSEIRLK